MVVGVRMWKVEGGQWGGGVSQILKISKPDISYQLSSESEVDVYLTGSIRLDSEPYGNVDLANAPRNDKQMPRQQTE